MAQYRKKPVVIEAIACKEAFIMMKEDFWSLPQWFIDAYEGKNTAGVTAVVGLNNPPRIDVVTLEGRMTADIGDWIIRGAKGEIYPCKPSIFEATYELVTP